MPRSLPVRPSLDYLKDQAKELLRSHRSGDASACGTLRLLRRLAHASDAEILAAPVDLNEVQFALAIEYGFSGWSEMKQFVESGGRASVSVEPGPEIGRLFSGSGFWNQVQAHWVRYAEDESQRGVRDGLRKALAAGSVAEGLTLLAFNDSVATMVRDLVSLAGRPGWQDSIGRSLEELAREMDREIANRKPVPWIANVKDRVRRTIAALDFYRPDDVLEIGAEDGKNVWVNFVSRAMSPNLDATQGAYDRDTQFMFEMNFTTGLFCWLSFATVPAFRGRGVGTRFARACEALAVDLGISRFSVEGPLNGSYWEKVMGYAIARGPIVHNMEGYKEIRPSSDAEGRHE